MPETVGLIGNKKLLLDSSGWGQSQLPVGGFGRSTEKQYDFAGDIPGQQQDRSLGCGGRGLGSEFFQWIGE